MVISTKLVVSSLPLIFMIGIHDCCNALSYTLINHVNRSEASIALPVNFPTPCLQNVIICGVVQSREYSFATSNSLIGVETNL